MSKKEIFWAITGNYGLYVGVWFNRFDAITHHADSLGKSWKQCYRRGDRAIKVNVIPTENESAISAAIGGGR